VIDVIELYRLENKKRRSLIVSNASYLMGIWWHRWQSRWKRHSAFSFFDHVSLPVLLITLVLINEVLVLFKMTLLS